MDSCETSGIEVLDHFREVAKMIEIGKGGHRKVKDYIISGTGSSLKWTISHSRMSFAYIMERMD